MDGNQAERNLKQYSEEPGMLTTDLHNDNAPRRALVAALLAMLSLSLTGILNAAEACRPARPYVLFILVDDYGIKNVGVEGIAFYETSNIDRLARGGMRLTQGYAAYPVCSPSRASKLGKYPPRHGITDYIGAAVGEAFAKQRHVKLLVPDYVCNLPAADTTLAEALKQSSYNTFFAGKWHLGSKGSWPENHGFDINRGGWDAGSPMGGYYAPWQNLCWSSEFRVSLVASRTS
jgi:arylsulfatase A-like enzyme